MLINPKEIIHTNVPRVTVSSIADLLGCPKKFELLRIRRNWPNGGPIDAVERGKALHAVMRELYVARVGGEVPLDRLGIIVNWVVRKTNYSASANREDERKRVSEMARAFVQGDDWEDIEGTIALEEQIDYDLCSGGRALLKISARLDRVFVRASVPKILVVRDYKSGAIRIDLAETYVNLRVAKHKWPGYERYILEVDGLDEDDRVVRETIDYSECFDMHQYFRLRAIEVLMAGYANGDWPAVPGLCCTYCPARQECQGLASDDIDNF